MKHSCHDVSHLHVTFICHTMHCIKQCVEEIQSFHFTPVMYIKSLLSELVQNYHYEGITVRIKSKNVYFVSLKKKTKSLTQAMFRYTIVGTLDDRSILSDEMANMCAKYPIYMIRKRSLLSAEVEKMEELKREYNLSHIFRLNIKYKELNKKKNGIPSLLEELK